MMLRCGTCNALLTIKDDLQKQACTVCNAEIIRPNVSKIA